MKISNDNVFNDYKPKFNEAIDNKDVINDSKLTKENLESLSKEIDNKLNSNYDNFVKIVSSTMNTLLEMAKGFLRF